MHFCEHVGGSACTSSSHLCAALNRIRVPCAHGRPREYTYSWFRDAAGAGRMLCSTWLDDDGRVSGGRPLHYSAQGDQAVCLASLLLSRLS